MNNQKFKLTNAAVSALFAAVLCILSQISVLTPWGVPFTLQIFAVALCGYVLGVKRATASVGAYILLGLVGVPVFSNFKGGIQALFGPTGGFVYGFLVLAVVCGLAKKNERPVFKIGIGIIGMLLCHLCGTVHLAVISKINLFAAFQGASLPFVLKDVLLITAACFAAKIINKRFKI